MEEIKLTVYGKGGEVVKEATASIVDLRFGTIRKLMKVLKVDQMTDTAELLNTVYSAWEELTDILEECFPDIEDADWDNVKVSELLPVLIEILKRSFSEIMTIPKDPKNASRE
jgi:hypothetical protein